MAANALTHLEIEAFCRLRHVRLSAWEVGVLCRVDDAVLGVWAEEHGKAKPADGEAKDPKGIKALFRRIGARKEATSG